MAFNDDLRTLVTIPSGSRNERPMQVFLSTRLVGLVDNIETDGAGNVYAHRKGNKDGHVMFSAHQDKVLYRNKIGLALKEPLPEFNTNLTFRFPEDFPTYEGVAFVKSGELYHPVDFPVGVTRDDLLLLKKGGQEKEKGRWEFVETGPKSETSNPATDHEEEIEGLHSEIDKLEKDMGAKGRTASARARQMAKTSTWGNSKSTWGRPKRQGYRRWIPGKTAGKWMPDHYGIPGHMIDVTDFDFGKYDDLDVFYLGNLQHGEKPGEIRGKFDDALGLALIIDALENTSRENTPDITAVFTVEEEIGHNGAKAAIKEGHIDRYNPDSIIVFDTTAKLRLGEGIALYEGCDKTYYPTKKYDTRNPQSPPQVDMGRVAANTFTKYRKSKAHDLEKELRRFARDGNHPLIGMPAGSNDSRTFAQDTDIPTVAIEVPIVNMHEDIETIDTRDVAAARRFINDYLTR